MRKNHSVDLLKVTVMLTMEITSLKLKVRNMEEILTASGIAIVDKNNPEELYDELLEESSNILSRFSDITNDEIKEIIGPYNLNKDD